MGIMATLSAYLSSAICLVSLSPVMGFMEFQQMIPNGESVPHPCLPNRIWKGVGHFNPAGSGDRNPFGVDFLKNNKQWSAVCHMDSDNDGRTNGEELGDPGCVWTPGAAPLQTLGLSHPGICQTADGKLCVTGTDRVDCTEETFECDALNSSDVHSVTLRFPLSRVPSKGTTQMCFPFYLPSDDEFHLIATEPFINNSYVMHHIVMFGCSDTASLDMTQTAPTECNMIPTGCDTALGGWTLGSSGLCMNSKMGVPFGLNGVKRAVLQFHWYNFLHVDDYYDASGFTIHYTANKRQYDSQFLTMGQLALNIPPGQPSISFTGRCSSDCTSAMLKDTIYVVHSANHMHYLGRSATTKQYRNGQLVSTIGDEPRYSYDYPDFFEYDRPLEILPGDDLVSTCEFSSIGRVNTTTFGTSASNEMCLPSLAFYSDAVADKNFISCLQFKTVDLCKLDPRNNFPVIDGCRWQEFTNREHPTTKQMIDEVTGKCVFGACTDECHSVIQNTKEHPCFQGDLGEYLYFLIASDPTNQQFIAALATCDDVVGRGGQLMALSWVLLAALMVTLLQ